MLVVFFLFALFNNDEPEVFLSKYFEQVILHAAHFQRVVKYESWTLKLIETCAPIIKTFDKVFACFHG